MGGLGGGCGNALGWGSWIVFFVYGAVGKALYRKLALKLDWWYLMPKRTLVAWRYSHHPLPRMFASQLPSSRFLSHGGEIF